MLGFQIESSVAVPVAGGTSQLIAVSTTSAQSTAFSNYTSVYMHNTVGVYVRQGTNPVAVNDGTDLFIPSGTWRLTSLVDENKLAFICKTGESGSVHLTPGA